MSETAVALRGVSKRFGEVVAVDDVSLEVRDGEFFSLLGPSGCGKTTTLRMVAGLEFPTSGSITIFGEEMALRPPNHRPVNTVFQSYALFPHMTVAENVGFGLEMRKEPAAEIRRRVDQALELVRLEGMGERRPGQLSGGQQQRVALARAVINNPRVLLLDEPLGALDLKLRQAMQVELKDIQHEIGITFIYVTHDQEEALTMSDRIGVMNRGKLLQVGAPEQIYERPVSRFVADFIGETNFIDARVVAEGRVELAGGREVRAVTHSVPGSQVTLTLRPEKLHLFRTEAEVPDGLNRMPGTVRRRLYYGDSFYYEIDLAADIACEARVENIPGLERFEAGEAVVVGFDPTSAEALTE